MAKRIQKKEIVQRLAARLSIDEKKSEEYFEAVLDTLYEAFKSGEGVTLSNFGSFYLDIRRSGCVFKFNPSKKSLERYLVGLQLTKANYNTLDLFIA